MLSYLDTQNTLHLRLVDFNLQQYLFVLQVVLGESPEVAYASVYDVENFKRNVPSEDEDEYLVKFKSKAEVMLDIQECRVLREELERQYKAEIQSQATDFKEYSFTGEDVRKLLAGLLHDRTQDLSESSVRDIIALIKTMYENGSLDSADGFEKHFITIPAKYNALCSSCSREFYAVEGLNVKCPHCGVVYTWSEEEHRFYPKPMKA